MPLDPKQVAKWSANDWNRKVQMIRPSDGGAQGVLFVFLNRLPSYGPALADFVVKPVSGSGANTVVAERLLGKAANAVTLDSTPVSPTSSLGKAMIASAASWPPKATGSIYAAPATAPYPWAGRLAEVAVHMSSATSLLIQRTGAFTELADAYRDGSFAAVLRDRRLMHNLGRLFVADAVLGNGDRLDALNTGNVGFDRDGNVVAIDSEAMLGRFKDILSNVQRDGDMLGVWSAVNGERTMSPTDYARGTVKGALRVPTPNGPKPAPTSNMQLIFDPAACWNHFRDGMETKLRFNSQDVRAAGGRPPLPPTPDDWAAGRTPFVAGVLDGLQRIDSMLGGLAWLKTKFHFKRARSKFGDDPNLSWTNFKMRRLIVQHAARGHTFDDAYAAAEAYANRKLPGF